MRNERMLAYLLIGLGVFSLLVRNGGADWLWLALLSIVFLFGYVSRQSYGFLIAGSVLMGVAVGSLIGSQGGMLLSLAAGFYAIDRVERRSNRWPFYAAGILAVLGALSALSNLGILTSVGFALLLVAGGFYLLYREHEKGSSPPSYSRTEAATPFSPAAPTTPPETTSSEQAAAASTVTAEPVGEGAPPPDAPQMPLSQPSAADTPGVTPQASGADETTVAREITPGAQERLARLEAWRRETAAEAGTPAYIIFSNDTLFRIASGNPQTFDELDKVRGVGPVKLERYGSAVLAILRGDTYTASGTALEGSS